MDMSNPLLPKYQLIFRNAVYFLALPFTLFLYRYDYSLPNTCILIISCIVSSLFFFFATNCIYYATHAWAKSDIVAHDTICIWARSSAEIVPVLIAGVLSHKMSIGCVDQAS